MFGYVKINPKELSKASQARYQSVYCGICRKLKECASSKARLCLSYDMAFLSLLLMSLYEPEEKIVKCSCPLHPVKAKDRQDNPFVTYGADMNVALAYYKALDDYRDEKKTSAKKLAEALKPDMERIEEQYPRQCGAMARCIGELNKLEQENCPNPDAPASCFGTLMAELLVYHEDLWAPTLRQMGMALGRYIYLADAAVDFEKDRQKNRYNPFAAMGMAGDKAQFKSYLVMEMGRCANYYERLPLVQDKDILDNILYSGIWITYRRKQKERKGAGEDRHDR